MNNDLELKNIWVSSLTGIIVSLIGAISFIVIGFLISLYFSGEAYPVYSDLYSPNDWANTFFSWFFWSTVASFIFNFIVTVFSMYCGAFFRSSVAWIIFLFLAIIIGIVFAIVFWNTNPEDTSCSTISFVLFIVSWVTEFILSTVFCSKRWRYDFIPWL